MTQFEEEEKSLPKAQFARHPYVASDLLWSGLRRGKQGLS